MINKICTKVYAGRIKNKKALINSSSGGAFTALSDVFLRNKDAVVCCSYDYKVHEVKYRLIETATDRDASRGSMYIQSKPYDIFRTSVRWLKKHPDKELLFVGMGCQAEGFRKYIEMKNLRDRVTIVDIVCHGSPSPLIWKEYAKSIGVTSELSFRDKRNGWMNPTAVAKVNGKEKSVKRYTHLFYKCCALRPSCHECPFTRIDRNTDITIGDFWNIEKKLPDFFEPLGTSLFLLHTNRGAELFESIKEKIDWRESNTVDCLQYNLTAPTRPSLQREEFWADYKREGIKYIMKKYGADPFYIRVTRKLKKIILGGQN